MNKNDEAWAIFWCSLLEPILFGDIEPEAVHKYLRKIAGEKIVKRIRREPDPFIQKIVSGWARELDAKRALALGFKAESTFEEIIRVHLEDELGGKIA